MIYIDKHNVSAVLAKIQREETAPKFLIIDLFCGAGGTTTGFEDAGDIAKVIACVNHDPIAIQSHWKNHPHVLHFEEDIRTLDLAPLKKIVEHYRKLYPDAIIILWGSIECTNYSKAKGGQSRDVDSRTLACHLFRYIHAIQPDYVQIENVVEFMSWGEMKPKIYKSKEGYEFCQFEYKDLTSPVVGKDGLFVVKDGECHFITEFKAVFDGVPDSHKNGRDWLRWCKTVNREMGSVDEWRQLNAADFGAYTSRNRLFGCFAKNGLPISWPEPTHAKKVVKGMFGQLQPWNAVKHCLDFEDEGESIFNRSERGKKELVEATLKRIYAGLIKHVAGGEVKFLLKYNSMSQSGKHVPPSVNEPCPVVPCQGRLGVVNTSFISKYFSGAPENKNISIDGPAGTVKTKDGQALVQAFLMKYYGTGITKTIDEPLDTITNKDRFAKFWLDKQYSGAANNQSIENPAGSILANDKHCMMSAPFIMNTSYNNSATSIEDPAKVITADRHWHYIVNPSHGGNTTSTENPCPVIIARQDKAPLSVIITESGAAIIPIYDTDSETMIKIKTFMAVYGIGDIKMRMLKVPELKKIQGFPDDYILEGSQTHQKKFIGNSVCPIVPKRWIEAMNNKLLTFKMTA